MNETTFSIGAALQACAAQVSPQQQPAPPVRAAGGRDRNTVPSVRLTGRQLEVLALLCEGLPNKLICRRLNIATGTVKVHMSCILRELGVKSRLEAVVAARRYGLIAEPARAAGLGEGPGERLPTVGKRQGFGRYGDVVAF